MLTSTVYRPQVAQRRRQDPAAVRLAFGGSLASLAEGQDGGLSPARWVGRSKNRRAGSGTIARRSAASSHAAHKRGSCPSFPGCLSLTAAQAARSTASASWMVSVKLWNEFWLTNVCSLTCTSMSVRQHAEGGSLHVRRATEHLIARDDDRCADASMTMCLCRTKLTTLLDVNRYRHGMRLAICTCLRREAGALSSTHRRPGRLAPGGDMLLGASFFGRVYISAGTRVAAISAPWKALLIPERARILSSPRSYA